MTLRAAIATVAAASLALGLAACDHKPTGYRPSTPAGATGTAKRAQ